MEGKDGDTLHGDLKRYRTDQHSENVELDRPETANFVAATVPHDTRATPLVRTQGLGATKLS